MECIQIIKENDNDKTIILLNNNLKDYDKIINKINKEILKIEQNIEPKVCRVCGSTENKFQDHKKTCNKCILSKSRHKLKENNYWKIYYNNNKEKYKKNEDR